MLMEIVRSMATFLLVLAIVFIGFSAAFSVLFRGSWNESYYARHEQAPPFDASAADAASDEAMRPMLTHDRPRVSDAFPP